MFVDRMRYVAAYLLAVLGGNKHPSKKDITNILESVGLDVEDEQLDKVNITNAMLLGFFTSSLPLQVVSELKGKDVETVIAEGMRKLASMPSGALCVYCCYSMIRNNDVP